MWPDYIKALPHVPVGDAEVVLHRNSGFKLPELFTRADVRIASSAIAINDTGDDVRRAGRRSSPRGVEVLLIRMERPEACAASH